VSSANHDGPALAQGSPASRRLLTGLTAPRPREEHRPQPWPQPHAPLAAGRRDSCPSESRPQQLGFHPSATPVEEPLGTARGLGGGKNRGRPQLLPESPLMLMSWIIHQISAYRVFSRDSWAPGSRWRSEKVKRRLRTWDKLSMVVYVTAAVGRGRRGLPDACRIVTALPVIDSERIRAPSGFP
jgi:hypothetical protein